MTTPFDQRRTWFAWFAVYMAVTGVLRAMTGHALGADEAEIMLHAQGLQWGYGGPPLYAWLQWAVFQMTGSGLAGLVLLKGFVLWLVPVLMLFLLSQALPVREAGLATLSLVLVPQIGFLGQVGLAGEWLALVLVLAFALGLWVVLHAPPHGSDWLGLGVVAGLALLAHPVSGLAMGALLAAAVIVPGLRQNLSGQGIGLALGVLGLICLGPVIWALTHDLTPGQPVVAAPPVPLAPVSALLAELWQVLCAAGLFVGPGVILVAVGAGLARLRGGEQATARTGDEALMIAWLLQATVIGAGALGLAVLFWPGSEFETGWLILPLVFVAPLLSLWVLPRLGEAGRELAGQVMVAGAVLIGGAVAFQGAVVPSLRSAPFDVLAPQVVGALPEGAVIAGDSWVLGNLVLEAPGLAAQLLAPGARPAPGTVVLWGEVAPTLSSAGRAMAPAGIAEQGAVSAPFHLRSERVLTLRYGQVPDTGEG